MTVINPAGFLQNAGATHTAEQMRNWFGAGLGPSNAANSLIPAGGVNYVRGFALLVQQTGAPSMAVIVRSGEAFIPGTEGSKQGAYAVLNDGDVTVSVTAAHATLSRIDLVCYKVEDSAYSGVPNTSSLVVVAGTAAASPSAPTPPNNSITLAQIAVGPAVATIVNANITDTRTYVASAGGVIPIRTSAQRPAASTEAPGTWHWNIAAGKYEFYNGTTFIDGMPAYKARSTLGAPAASVTFSSIPGNLRSLRLVYRASTSNGSASGVSLRINGNAAGVYTFHITGATDAAVITPSGGISTDASIGTASGGASFHFGAGEVIFPGWDQTSVLNWFFNSFAWDTVLYTRSGGGTYNVAGPYTSITVFCVTGNFLTGSDFSIEGVYA